MKNNKKYSSRLPKGMTYEHVEEIRKHYESQTDEEAAAEDDAMFDGRHGTVIVVPNRLVPRIRKMLAQEAAKPKTASNKWRTRKSTSCEAAKR